MAAKLRDLTPEELELRNEAAKLIRKHLWLGSNEAPAPPHPNDRPWHMGRDLSIWKRLVLLGNDAEELNGAIAEVRGLLPRHGAHKLRMTVFYSQADYTTPLLEEAKGLWRKRQPVKPSPVKGHARDALKSLLRELTAESG